MFSRLRDLIALSTHFHAVVADPANDEAAVVSLPDLAIHLHRQGSELVARADLRARPCPARPGAAGPGPRHWVSDCGAGWWLHDDVEAGQAVVEARRFWWGLTRDPDAAQVDHFLDAKVQVCREWMQAQDLRARQFDDARPDGLGGMGQALRV